MEPHIHKDACGALYSQDAGTLTPYEYAIALAENACDNGVELRLRRQVIEIKQLEEGPHRFEIKVKHWDSHPEYLNSSRSGRCGSVISVGIILAALGALLLVYASNASSSFRAWQVQTFGNDSSAIFIAYSVGAVVVILHVLYSSMCSTESNSGKATKWSYSPSPGTVLEGWAEDESILCDYIVNAAGCSSDKIARMVGDDSFIVKPRMGEYILLHKDEGFRANHTLFPAPHPVYGKGVLCQATLWGNLILGPTARDTMKKNKETGQYEIDEAVRDEPTENIMGYILSKCRNLVPNFDAAKVIHSFSGARAKNSTGDWIIGPVDGVDGFFNAASIDSPGIAASPAIAADVARMVSEAAGNNSPLAKKDPLFNPFRAPIIRPKQGFKGLKMKQGLENTFAIKDPAKNVVCKCEKVTEAEIVEAMRRSLPIDSTQAIRKRTRAGMGHCQGDPDNYCCEQRVARIIARENRLRDESKVGTRPWPASSMLTKRHPNEKDKQRLVELSDPSITYVLNGAAK